MSQRERIEELLQSLEGYISDIKSYHDDALREARDATNEAYEAKNSAERAEEYIDSAIDKMDSIESWLDNVEEEMGELKELLAKELEDAEGTVTRDLKAEIKRWMPRVRPQLDNGSTHAHIASNLGISEFLVQCIDDEARKQRAEA